MRWDGRAAGFETAMEWYYRAAELGEAMADYNMGWHLEQAGKLSGGVYPLPQSCRWE